MIQPSVKTLLISLFLIPAVAFSQIDLKLLEKDETRKIPNDVNVIYVKNADFKKVCTALMDAGFTIDKKDNELQTVETRMVKNDFWLPVISARVRDSVTIIKVRLYNTVFNREDPAFYYQNKKGKPRQDAFVHAFLQGDKIAKMLGGEIEYKEEQQYAVGGF